MPNLWINPQGGASGDMFLAALLDLGLNKESLLSELKKLPIKQTYKIECSDLAVRGFAGKQVKVFLKNKKVWESPEKEQTHSHDHSHKHHHHIAHSDITDMIKASDLNEHVKELSLKIFHHLAEAEATVHGKSIDTVQFHEVGATDSIIDIVGTAIGIDTLNIQNIYSSPVGLGSGTVDCAHGRIPIPAPATTLLLQGLPVFETGEHKEMCTPTAAAILKTIARFDKIPNTFSISKVGLGLSHSIPKKSPPFLRLSLFESQTESEELISETLHWLSCNLDDMSPEYLPMVSDKLLELGVLDVSLCPILMKKGRSGHELRALVQPDLKDQAIAMILKWTSTFGVRIETIERQSIQREFTNVKTPWGEIQVKRGHLPKGQIKHHIEYEDVKVICDKHNVTWQEVIDSIHFD